MAVENIKSTLISNRDSLPAKATNAMLVGAFLKEAIGAVEIKTSHSVNSTYRFLEIPSNARISQVLLSNTDAGTGNLSIGVFHNTVEGGGDIDDDYFRSGMSINADVFDYLISDNPTDLGKAEKPLWELLGLSEDPYTTFDIVGTLLTAVGNDCVACIKVRYVV